MWLLNPEPEPGDIDCTDMTDAEFEAFVVSLKDHTD